MKYVIKNLASKEQDKGRTAFVNGSGLIKDKGNTLIIVMFCD